MTNATTDPRFYAALQQALQASSAGPINSSAFLQDRDLAMAKAGTLLSYQSYLAQARSWKAARKTVPLSFEREVQGQAAQALSDTRDLAMSALRMISQMKQAGQLDRIMDSTIAGIQSGGPAQLSDIWAHVANDSSARQALKDAGLTEDLFTAINEDISKLVGQLYLQGGKLAVDVTVAGQEKAHTAVFSRPAPGPPNSLHDLLTRGQFERMVEQFGQLGALLPDHLPGATGDLEVPDVILAGAVRSVQLMAQHKRKLEDTGLATYAGNDPFTPLIIATIGFFLVLLGASLINMCGDGEIAKNSDLCEAGAILFFLGAAGLIAGGGPVGWAIVIFIIYISKTQEKGGNRPSA